MSPDTMKTSKTRPSARTHGLYAKRLSKEEWGMIEALEVHEVQGEIAMQRALIARLAKILEKNGLGPRDQEALTEETRRTMKLMQSAMGELRHYIRLHTQESLRLDEPGKQIEEGKDMARKRLHVLEYLDAESGEDADEEPR